ncbi:hypothetical protein GIB67_013988 [Kingdonia uniflora]|uniref:Pentatricopeptide repeat-containing protein n=1 Tax=Kingdonia uniflora TaxID=39325 RepID=A0A7J7LDJ8_9MAGN|nr:hypothetical protein GIB67_013988 [Kingdonia uniflora]
MQGDQTLLGDKAPQGGRFPLEFDDTGSKIGEYRAKFATKCGELAKTHVSPIIRDWRLVDDGGEHSPNSLIPGKEGLREVLTTVAQNIPGLVDENFDQDAVSNKMLQLALELDKFCVAIGIAACAHSGALRQGMWIHEYIRKRGLFREDLFVGTALVDMYAKCGCIKRSVEVFEGLFKRNEYSWSAMIGGFALHGLANQAIFSLERMVKEDGVCPNGVVLLGVLAACTHAGLEEEGIDLLEHMEGRYGVVPKHEHYSCTVNFLCRAGRLDKALELIRRMIMKPFASVWGALLSAYSIKGNVELAELAAKELLDLEPSNGVGVGKDSTYV